MSVDRKGFYSEQELDTVKSLWTMGVSAGRIVSALKGRSRDSIMSVVRRMGLQRGSDPTKSVKPKPQKTVHHGPPSPRPLPGRLLAPPRPLKGSTPRPWTTRRFGECAFPFEIDDDVLSCCLPVKGEKKYCPQHCAVMYVPSHTKLKV